jgi:hypothetical protein
VRKSFDFSEVKVPRAVEDLYRDLRDRKLLPIVALLLVAIVAVPFLLSSSSETPTVNPPSAADDVVVAPEAQSAVLAQDPGLRNYQQRLDSLKATNPFEQQYQITAAPADGEGAGGLVGGDSTGLTSPSTSGSTGGGSTSTPPSSGGGTDTAADAVTEDTTIDVDETVEGAPESTLLTFRTDLHYGPEGDVKASKNVKLLHLLEPVGAFIGGTQNGKSAAFAMSSHVAAVTGEGKCAPDPGTCDFLLLEEGKSAGITYQPADGGPAVVYRLAVDDLRLVEQTGKGLEGKLSD